MVGGILPHQKEFLDAQMDPLFLSFLEDFLEAGRSPTADHRSVPGIVHRLRLWGVRPDRYAPRELQRL